MKRRNKSIIDKVSASLILETYLNLNKKYKMILPILIYNHPILRKNVLI